MREIEFDRICYRINGDPVFLYSGEFHYFRVPKQAWEERMKLFKEAGGNCIATYVPWIIHEPEEGRFVFGGDDGTSDIEGFLKTAEKVGLYVIARPGPYQYSELRYCGLPGWLCENYPQLLARKFDGSLIRPDAVSYLHPLFLKKVRGWFSRICPILAKHTVSNGGCIAFTQFDNELMGVQHSEEGFCDYNEETMGFGKPEGRYAKFLRSRYGNVDTLNRRYGLSCSSFETVRPIAAGSSSKAEDIRRIRDYFDFYMGTVAEYAQTLCGMMREYGIDTDFIHNAANPHMNAFFLETSKALGKHFLLGSDHYYNLDQTWDQNNPTPQYATRVFLSLEILRLMGYPPSVFELPSGSCSDWPPITPEDSRACYLTNLAYGMKGSNFYIFTGGPNPEGVGLTSDLYDYNAPVGADGKIRPLYYVQKEIGNYLKNNAFLAESEREADCRIALDFEYARSDQYWKNRNGYGLTNTGAFDIMMKGTLTTSLCAGMSPVFVNMDSDDWTQDTGTPLIVVSSSSMARSKQERLVRFLQNGGGLLIMPLLPELDEQLLPCTVLADFLGKARIEKSGRAVSRPAVGGVDNVLCDVVYDTVVLPEGAEILGTDELSGTTIAWSKTVQGGGKAVVLGISWYHRMNEHIEMLRSLLGEIGYRQKVICSNPNIWTSLRTAGEKSVLFIMNLFSSPMQAEIEINREDGSHIHLGNCSLGPMTVELVDIGTQQ